MGVKRPGVSLRIEQLVLEGVAPGDRERVADALRRELGALFDRVRPGEWPRTSIRVATVDGGVVRSSEAAGLGAGVARAVYGAALRQPVAPPEGS
jgi:hypothetical protein